MKQLLLCSILFGLLLSPLAAKAEIGGAADSFEPMAGGEEVASVRTDSVLVAPTRSSTVADDAEKKPTKKAKNENEADEKTDAAVFVDVDGDGINDGKENRFRRGLKNKKAQHQKRMGNMRNRSGEQNRNRQRNR